MPKIQCLDSHIADLIAAGEVVERPASVVKELVENAIDAGASSVTVAIRRGGMSYIRVTDNGCGIAPEDAETAFLRHATSKIRSERDLEAIGTLGFRGEALAAISAVSKVEMTTRRPEDELGTALLLDGGELRTRQETGCPAGTTIIVRELFFNTPARLKFMKRDVTEGAAVFGVVQHIAMSHPEISFRFLREEREDLLTPGDGSLKAAVYSVLGRDIALGFLPCKTSGEEGIQVEGFVSRPACCRGSRGYQHFFVNGRYVRSRTMTAALEEAYQNQKMVGKFPACVLHLTSRLNSVDVNVHPAKTEVKFSNEKALFAAVYHAVKGALAQETGHPQMELETAEKKGDKPQKPKITREGSFFQTMTAEEFRSGSAGKGLVLGDGGAVLRQRLAREIEAEAVQSPKTPAPAPMPPKPVHVVPKRFRPAVAAEEEFRDMDLPVLEERPARSASFERALEKREQEPTPSESVPVEKIGDEAPKTELVTAKSEKNTQNTPVNVDKTVEKAEKPEETPLPPREASTAPAQEPDPAPIMEQQVIEAEQPLVNETPAWRMSGEVMDTYIIVEQGDKVFFIDKHAAHERMNFDRLKAQDYRPMQQLLMTPVVLNLPPEETAALLGQLPLLEQFGFEAEEFGRGSLIVRQTPDYLPLKEVEPTLSELAQKFLTTGTADPAAARDHVLHTMACKSAIKGGWKSGAEELMVVAEAVMSGRVKYCPHGRPVAIEMTRKQLEKSFKRV